MKKKITAVGIVVAMLSTGLSSFAANTADYSDIPQGWAKDAIVYALDNGILKGDDGKVSPDRQLTRAEMAAIISRAMGYTEEADISSYTDVSKDAWYYADMAKAVAAGVFNGYENKLNPEANITREEVFAVIQRAYKLSAENPADLSQFNDEENISDWAKDAASVLVAKGYINGADGSLNPKANITRAELAQIIYNISGKNNASENPNTTADPDATADPNATAAPDTTAAPTATPRPSSGGGSSSVRGDSTIYKTSFKLDDESNTDVSKVTVDGVEYYVAQLTKAMSSYVFTVGGKSVTPTAVNADGTIVKYSADAKADTKKYAKTNLTYGEYWYPETSDGYKGELSAKFTKDGEAVSIPESYTAGQSAEDKYAAVGADSDAGMYDAVSRATTGYGLGRMSLKQDVTAKAADGSMQPFVSGIKQDGDTYTVVRPSDAKDNFSYDGSSNRGSNGETVAAGIRDVTVAVSSDMLVNANILKDIDGYKSQAEAVIAAASKLTFDDTLTDENVYAYKELTSAGIYGKRVVNENVQAKEIGSVSEANTTADNTFTVNTKYGRRYGDVTFLVYFDDFKDMKEESGYGSANINGDDKTAGKVGEFKNYVYNVTGAKIEYLGADGKSEPIVAGAKFASDVWISPNHGPVVEVAVSNSYDRFKSFGDGQYRITLMADGYKDVVLETGASFNVKNPIEMQTEDDDIDEITGTDLVLTYNIVNQNYVNALKAAVEARTSAVTLTSGKNTVASATKLEDKDGVLTVTFENVKDSLTKDTQYGVEFPTLDLNDPDKLGTTMSIHYAPADETTVELKDKVTVNGSDYYYAKAEEGSKFTLNGNEVEAKQIGSTGIYIYSEKPAEGKRYAKTTLTYGEYWYPETSDGYKGELLTEFTKNGEAVSIPESYTAGQSAEDKYAAVGADSDAGMYDAVSRATTGYGLGRMSLKQDVTAKAADGSMQPFVSGIKQDGDTYTVIRPSDAQENFGYIGSSNRGSNGETVAEGIRDVVVAVSNEMLVNANVLKNFDGYKSQAEAVIAAASKLTFDDTLTDENVYSYKELTSAGIYGKRVVNENVQAKEIGSVSEANTADYNTFTPNTKYARRFGDVTFLIYFDEFKNMKEESGYGSANVNGDDKTAGKVGELKNYVYNVTGAKIEYLGEDGKSEPIVAGAKFASDVWISPNHGPVVEVAVSNSYDRFKAFGNGQYRITLMADGYKDVVFTSEADFDIKNPLEMQTEDDDIPEITDGSDLTLTYNIVNATYVEALKEAVEAGSAAVTLTNGDTVVASASKLEDKDGVLTVTFENVKDSLTKDTQYGVEFPTLNLNDPNKLGMTASVHYAPAE